tara:strand:+ start:40 stop:1116 length:1077 start_codon:yes stop_codon:yes gene_type:complete
MGDEEEIVKITDFVEANTLRVVNKTIFPPSFQLINGFIDRTKIIEVWDDFIGSTGSTQEVVPGHPWSTDGSDTVAIKSKGVHGGVWELSIASTESENKQMVLHRGRGSEDGGGIGKSVESRPLTGAQFFLGPEPTSGIHTTGEGRSLHFKARFRRTHSTEDDHGFFIGLTSHNEGDLISDQSEPGAQLSDIKDLQSHYGLLMLKTQNGGKYKVVGQTAEGRNLGLVAPEFGSSLGGETTTNVGYWPPEGSTVGRTDQLSTRTGTGEGMDPDLGWIVFEMNINKQNTNQDEFTVSYQLTDQLNTGDVVYKTGEIFIDNNSCSREGEHRYMSPAIHLKKGTSNPSVLSYEIDYIHCVQKR